MSVIFCSEFNSVINNNQACVHSRQSVQTALKTGNDKLSDHRRWNSCCGRIHSYLLRLSSKEEITIPHISHCLDQYVTIFVFRMLGSYNRKKLEKDCKNLRAVQDEKLLGLLQAAKDTKYGKIHGLSKITSREDYVRFHPLTRFDHYKPFVECLLKGEEGVITKDRPIILALTSGPTVRPKYCQ
ncbi:hypothetical protein BSL78_24647 [Apostichopus japonicus]|uniref:Uncharacterized protein n=1 Tax=Stichopus japonicus TaxID=307972 RepID=A0A2G8JS23_STIJA|nr:hypothetical protein BSL78_24647 [Apostichopus japonicus]